jgi:hypothetical protein
VPETITAAVPRGSAVGGTFASSRGVVVGDERQPARMTDASMVAASIAHE